MCLRYKICHIETDYNINYTFKCDNPVVEDIGGYVVQVLTAVRVLLPAGAVRMLLPVIHLGVRQILSLETVLYLQI